MKISKTFLIVTSAVLLMLCTCSCTKPLKVTLQTVDLARYHDAAKPLENPHKGWYHHYYDNSLDKYIPRSDEEIKEFPGMDHIYLRFAWSYLEPEEGRFFSTTAWKTASVSGMTALWLTTGHANTQTHTR